MFRPESLFTLAATFLSGFFLAACVLILPADAFAADDGAADSTTPCTCPESQRKATRPKFAGLSHELDEVDEMAALESVQLALSKVGDGATYVWHRSNGRISGLVQPTASFRNQKGSVCRHLILLLTTGDKTAKTEGVACRDGSGRWQLEG